MKKKVDRDSDDLKKEKEETAEKEKKAPPENAAGPEMLSEIYEDLEKMEKQECPDKTAIFALKEQSEVMWRSIKNSELPVVGFNQLQGELKSGEAPDSFAMEISMLPETTFSSDQLRDSRIVEYFFAAMPISFKSNSISLETFHEVGQTRIAEITGILSVGAFEQEVTVITDYTMTTYGLMLRTVQPLRLSIEDDLNMADNLESLLGLVEDVTVEDEVDISFTVHFLDICA